MDFHIDVDKSVVGKIVNGFKGHCGQKMLPYYRQFNNAQLMNTQ